MLLARNILLWALGTIVIACNTKNFSQEINKIDLRLSTLEDQQQIYSDTVAINEKYTELTNLVWKVLSIYKENNDTLKREDALLMAQCQTTVKALSHLREKYNVSDQALTHSKNQLGDLRHDLEHKLLDANFVKTAIQKEFSDLNEITNQFDRLNNEKDSLFLRYEELLPNLSELLTKIKSKH